MMCISGSWAACAAAVFVLCISCGKKGENWEYALASGTYDLSGPVCVSTDAKPVYKDIARRINLFDFDGVTTHSLTVDGFNTRRVIADADCTLTVEQPVETNRDGAFALKIAKKAVFAPEGCMLTVSAGSKAFEAGKQSSEAFNDSDNSAMDVPYEIRAAENTPDTLLMISTDNETLNAVWGDYGCSVPDRVKWTLKRKPEA